MILKGMWLFCFVACFFWNFTLASELGSDSNDDYAYEEDSFFVVPVMWEQADQADLEDVKLYVQNLLKDVNPHQISLVIDVDGTLTNRSDPTSHQGAAQARGTAVQFVKECVDRGINVVVSSAWPSFEETIQRLKDIGLGDALRINNGEIHKGKGRLFGVAVEYACLGLVASVKNAEDEEFFRQKVFAFHYIYPNLDLKTIKCWVFADDNASNISLFKNHIFHIYRESEIKKEEVQGDVFVKMFCLSMAKGEATLK